VFLYEGYSDGELWKMAYTDNEQSGTQKQLSIVDVWLDYKAKKEQGRKQQEIAQSLGVSEAIVSYRIQLAEFPESILEKISFTCDSMTERDCRELLNLHRVKNERYDYEAFLSDIIDTVFSKSTNPNSKHFQREVVKYNEAIEEVELWLQKIADEEYSAAFLEDITEKGTKSKGLIANQ